LDNAALKIGLVIVTGHIIFELRRKSVLNWHLFNSFKKGKRCAKEPFYSRYKIRIGDTNHASDDDNRDAVDVEILSGFLHPNFDKKAAYYDVAVLVPISSTFYEELFHTYTSITSSFYVSARKNC
jgi:hypothetical protein